MEDKSPDRKAVYTPKQWLSRFREESELTEQFWRRLSETKQECEVEIDKAQELLISKFMTAKTEKRLQDKLMKGKKIEMEKTIELIKQDSYGRKTEKTQYRKR